MADDKNKSADSKGATATKEDLEAMQARISELEAQNSDLHGALAEHSKADLALAESKVSGNRVLVQFFKDYAFAGFVSEINPRKWLVKPFRAKAGTVGRVPAMFVKSKEDDALVGDDPKQHLLTTDPKAFRSFERVITTTTGKGKDRRVETKTVKVDAKELAAKPAMLG